MDLIVVWLLGIFFLLYVFFVGWHLLLQRESEAAKLILKKGSWTLGLPATGLGAFALVKVFPVIASTDGGQNGLKINIGGAEFSGPVTELTYWIIIFVVIVWACDKVRPQP